MNDGTVYIYANVWYVYRDMITANIIVHYLAFTLSCNKKSYKMYLSEQVFMHIYLQIAVVHSISLEFARRA